ncbi:MAG TPA: FtsQ-type POTRA domain-containing protein [Gemmatimonadales bacterium]|nr:FtsQ-type POTRA domain-containing protein [Gemmatimonadales bacterium]
MSARLRFLRDRRVWIPLVSLAALALLWLGGPEAARHLSFFRVRQVELVGVRNLAPEAVIQALGLSREASVFDPTGPLEARVRALPGVADVRVRRRLPGALAVVVREAEPAAFVPGPRGLVVVDAAARPLPFDPARTVLDLPLAASADSNVTAVLGLVRAVDPALYQSITSARRIAHGVVLDEGGARRRVLMGLDPQAEVIQAVVRVQQDLAAKGRAYAELDARFAGQIVVRRKATS